MLALPPGEGIHSELSVGVTYKLVIDQSKFFKQGGLALGQSDRYDAVSTDHAYLTPIGISHKTGVSLFEVGYRVYWKEKWIQRGASPAGGAVLETEGPFQGRWYDDIIRQVTLKEFQEKNLQVAGEIPYQSFFNPDKR